MQGGARKAAMAGFFFFTKKRLDGAASAPRRPPRAAGRPDDFADHSCGYPRPSRAAGRFYARQRPLRRHPRPFPRAAGRKIERRRHGSRGRAPAAHRARQAGLTILPTIPADTRAPPTRQAGFMPGSDRCAAILAPARARRAAKSSDAGTEAWAVPPPPTAPLPRGRLALWRQRPLRRHPRPFPRAADRKIERRRHGSLGRTPAAHRAPPARQTGFMAAATVAPPSSSLPARGRPQNRATQARKPGPRPRRPPRAAGRPDDFADHSCGYPRPSRAAGRFYARQRPLRRHPRPFPRAADRKSERRRHGSRGRTPAVSDRRRGQRFFAKEARGIVKRDGKGAAAQGETGAAAGRTEWESGRAPGMEERMMAGPGGGNGENGRESGRARREKGEEESGRARRGGRAGAEETEP